MAANAKRDGEEKKKGSGKNQDHAPTFWEKCWENCWENCCCCCGSSSSSGNQDHQPSSEKTTVPDKRQNGKNTYRNGGQSVKNPSPEKIVSSSNEQAKDPEKVTEKKPEPEMETVDRSKVKKSSDVGLPDGSTEAKQRLSREKPESPKISNPLSNEQQKIDPPKKTASSPEVWQSLPTEEQQNNDVKEETSHRRPAAKVANRSSGYVSDEQREGVLNDENKNESYTKKIIGDTEQADLSLRKQKEKDVVGQESIKKGDKSDNGGVGHAAKGSDQARWLQ